MKIWWCGVTKKRELERPRWLNLIACLDEGGIKGSKVEGRSVG